MLLNYPDSVPHPYAKSLEKLSSTKTIPGFKKAVYINYIWAIIHAHIMLSCFLNYETFFFSTLSIYHNSS